MNAPMTMRSGPRNLADGNNVESRSEMGGCWDDSKDGDDAEIQTSC